MYRVGGASIHVSHGHELGAPTPPRLIARYPDADVLVYGHTHQALVTRVGARLVVNPGAAGPARFKLRPSVGRLYVRTEGIEVEIVPLDEA
jgi:predicted phosphodiesterase